MFPLKDDQKLPCHFKHHLWILQDFILLLDRYQKLLKLLSSPIDKELNLKYIIIII